MAQATSLPPPESAASALSLTEEKSVRSIRLLTHQQLVLMRFRKNRLAVLGLVVLVVLYITAIFCEFLAPYDANRRFQGYVHVPPSVIHLRTTDGQWQRPFIYKVERTTDLKTFERTYAADTSTPYPIKFLVRGDPYVMWGFIQSDLHLFGVDEAAEPFAILGGDAMGRDLLSRIFYGGRISLSIPLVGVFLSLLIGLTLGGISGYYGGVVDNIVQRLIELIRSIPTIPLWMGLAAALPPNWPQLRVYIAITVILSFVGWTTLARVIRGKFLALREEDFVLAALQAGARGGFVIREHLIPSFTSYILVYLTLAIPGLDHR